MNFLLNTIPLVSKMAQDDYVGFTFFFGCMAMMAASIFFFFFVGCFYGVFFKVFRIGWDSVWMSGWWSGSYVTRIWEGWLFESFGEIFYSIKIGGFRTISFFFFILFDKIMNFIKGIDTKGKICQNIVKIWAITKSICHIFASLIVWIP